MTYTLTKSENQPKKWACLFRSLIRNHVMKEKALYQKLRDSLSKHRIILQRIESPMTNLGIPDVCYSYERVSGFIELKVLKQWPKRPETKIRIPHFSNHQKVWLYQHYDIGKHSFLFLNVQNDFLLFRGDASFLIEDCTKEQLFQIAVYHSENSIDSISLLEALI